MPVNETIQVLNEVVVQAPGAAIWQRLIDLIFAPYRHPELLWIVFPMVIGLILMEIYFGRYKEETMGWNSAVGNSLILVFVAIDLFKKIYGWNANPIEVLKNIFSILIQGPMSNEQFLVTLVAFMVMTWGFVLMFVDFFHLLPEKLAFTISSTLFINVFAYTAIVVVYSSVGGDYSYFSWITTVATVILLIALWLLFGLIHLLEPKKYTGFFLKYNKKEE